MKKFYFSLVCLMFVACGDSNIDIVKNATLDENKTMTIGDAIDYYKDCKKVKWKDISKEGQKIVSVTCKLKDEALQKQLEEENAQAKTSFIKYEKPRYERQINNNFYLFKKTLKISSKTAVKFPKLEEITDLANKYCHANTANKQEQKCDEALYEELKKYNYEPKEAEGKKSAAIKTALEKDLFEMLLNQKMTVYVPKVVKTRTYNVNFYINTDKSVALKDSSVIDDDVERKVYSKAVLHEFYKRD